MADMGRDLNIQELIVFEATRIKGEPAIRHSWEHRRSGHRFVGVFSRLTAVTSRFR
jgi:hypothetical protein